MIGENLRKDTNIYFSDCVLRLENRVIVPKYTFKFNLPYLYL